ncbi:MAG: hypothetical protein AAGJ35_14435 [Myxococcota bacterium]
MKHNTIRTAQTPPGFALQPVTALRIRSTGFTHTVHTNPIATRLPALPTMLGRAV